MIAQQPVAGDQRTWSLEVHHRLVHALDRDPAHSGGRRRCVRAQLRAIALGHLVAAAAVEAHRRQHDHRPAVSLDQRIQRAPAVDERVDQHERVRRPVDEQPTSGSQSAGLPGSAPGSHAGWRAVQRCRPGASSSTARAYRQRIVSSTTPGPRPWCAGSRGRAGPRSRPAPSSGTRTPCRPRAGRPPSGGGPRRPSRGGGRPGSTAPARRPARAPRGRGSPRRPAA